VWIASGTVVESRIPAIPPTTSATSALRTCGGSFVAGFTGLLADTGLTPAQARDKLLGDQPLWRDQTIYRRAHDRGEIDLDRIPPAVLAMPFDLVRHDLMMNLKPLKPARITSIIDDLFLPLVQPQKASASD
jgi:Tetracyclin repressor-like, C-terminal domain